MRYTDPPPRELTVEAFAHAPDGPLFEGTTYAAEINGRWHVVIYAPDGTTYWYSELFRDLPLMHCFRVRKSGDQFVIEEEENEIDP